jgi:hypothetical protein
MHAAAAMVGVHRRSKSFPDGRGPQAGHAPQIPAAAQPPMKRAGVVTQFLDQHLQFAIFGPG